MVFKELEIQGFKSFPDKVKITFDEGVTGVVGPNGSGKSNLSDAVRWVLGETSARQLRAAGKMEDVIFGGTRRRVPPKMPSSIFPAARSWRELVSPSTPRTASERFDLPEPLGPTPPVTPSSKRILTISGKLLKP